eukprot:CAMPEP_0198605362 /NCGR_PEP_ID=MMETSP1462-20131121/154331_1 /TAXON_ID=1333877 /ORGANISM="Brandtodinium nutriculum, Strain RCC3387" /LENGTH=37 /DNA_ID= /DNA_START= /DNA_END= /DNA_ORIENTATION=
MTCTVFTPGHVRRNANSPQINAPIYMASALRSMAKPL